MNILSFIYFILILLSGIITAFILPIQLRKFFKLFIGPALGIVIITSLTLLVSLILGFNQISIFVSLILYVFTSYILLVNLKNSPFCHCEEPEGRRGNLFIELARRLLQSFSLLRNDNNSKSRIYNPESRINALKEILPFLFILGTIGTFVIYIFASQVLAPTSYGLVTGGGGLWGDTAMHSAFTMSLVEQGIPPQNPLFAGRPLVYPFLVNFFSAILVKIGSSLRFAFILPQIAYFLGFLALFYSITLKFTGKLGTVFAILIFFLGWGLGFTQYYQDINTNHSLAVTREYTNNLPGNFLHNPLTGLIFPERALLPGLFIGMLITLLVLNLSLRVPTKSERGNLLYYELRTMNYELIIVGILLGLLPLWHTHTFIVFGVCIFFWIITMSFRGIRPEKSSDSVINNTSAYMRTRSLTSFEMTKSIKSLFIVYGVAILVALPALLWLKSNLSGSFLHFINGWMLEKSNFFVFWWKNTGLLIPLSILGIIFLSFWNKSRCKSGRSDRIFNNLEDAIASTKSDLASLQHDTINPFLFFLPFFILFIITNYVSFQPWDWDNIKIFTWIFLFLAIPTGHFLSQLISRHPERSKGSLLLISVLLSLISIVIFISLTASGTLSLINQSQHTFTIYDNFDIDFANWVKLNTAPTDIFLVDPQPTHPLQGLTGRSAFMGYAGHLWVHGINYGKREAIVNRVLKGEIGALNEVDVKINYLVVDINKKIYFTDHPNLKQVFSNQKYIIFKVI